MATFYVLPPRTFLGEWYSGYLRTCFPGLEWPPQTWPDLADVFCQPIADYPDVYLVHREDLPPNCNLTEALTDGFGAELGDEVVEVYPAAAQGSG